MMRYLALTVAAVALAFGAASADPSGNNVVINEIMVNPPYYYDGAEYIELYNPTALPIDIGGWVLCGTEYAMTCGGEDRWQFPVGTQILPNDYITVAKDGGDGVDGFFEVYGFRADFELYDDPPSPYFESDDPLTPDLICLDDDASSSYSDEIGLFGGNGYGRSCTGGSTSNSDVLYLYTGPALAVLVDVVEYYDDYECGGDPCVGDDLDDESGFVGIPYAGSGLGRYPNGEDSDRNVADFRLMQPTPDGENSSNAPPWISTVRYSPTPPVNMGDVTVSALITDDGTVAGADLHYNVDGSGWVTVAMTAAGDDYSAIVPGQMGGAAVQYYITATDDDAYTIAAPVEGSGEPYAYSVGMTSIYNVQFEPGRAGGRSQLEGQPVNVRGIVTAGSDVFSGSFWIHEDTGSWKGVRCRTYLDDDILEGDDVTICGTVREVYDETVIYPHFDEGIIVHSQGNPIYGYTTVTGADIDELSAGSEEYEGQLISLANATVTALPNTYGEWYVTDDGGVSSVQVDDWGYYAYDPEIGDLISDLRGIVMYSFSAYEVQPRGDEDIIGPPRVTNVRYSPAPPVADDPVTVSCDITAGGTITSAKLYWKLNSDTVWSNVDLVHQGGDQYSVAIGGFSADTEIDYYVLAIDNAGMDARRPSVGNYGFYVGTVTINSIQFVAAPGVDDESPLVGHAVNTEGYVVAEPGVFGPNTFYIAEAAGAWNGIAVYDGSGSLTFTRGDYVTVGGTVDEYYGMTQIDLHFPETAHTTTPPRPEAIAPTDIATGLLQSANTAEQYESVLVRAQDCEVTDQNEGYGEWSASNTGFEIDECRVGDEANYDYEPAKGAPVDLIGVVAYSFEVYKIEPRGDDDIEGPSDVPGGEVGRKLALAQNRPNPFNPKTAIAFSLPQATDVSLEIYDVAGRKVTTLVEKRLGAGPHSYEWNGLNQNGERVASGVYFYRLAADERVLSKKMVLLK